MSHVLTSWKEIALYVGKGVRTVQRWEQQTSFPVRRSGQNRVLAVADEIDAWIRLQHTRSMPSVYERASELAGLRQNFTEIVKEAPRLRALGATARSQVTESKLSLALTFCNVAESELRDGRVEQANKLLRHLRALVESIRCHLDVPNYVPPDALDPLRHRVAQLELRISNIEAQFSV